MRVRVQAWGNSLGLRIPKAYATELGVQAGTEMEINIDAGALRAQPAPVAQLEALLAEITDENQPHESDWGAPRGAEAWWSPLSEGI